MDTEGFSVEHGPGPADADARNARRCRTDDPLPPVEALSHPVGDSLQRLTIWRRKERFSPLQLVHYELRQNEAPFAVLAASNAHPLERSMVITRENDALPDKVRLGKLRWQTFRHARYQTEEQFTLYDGGKNHRKKTSLWSDERDQIDRGVSEVNARAELCSISFSPANSFSDDDGGRVLEVRLPSGETLVRTPPIRKDGGNGMPKLEVPERDGTFFSMIRSPRGSKKNVQLRRDGDPLGDVVLQLCRETKHSFSLEFRKPLSALHAYGIALAVFRMGGASVKRVMFGHGGSTDSSEDGSTSSGPCNPQVRPVPLT